MRILLAVALAATLAACATTPPPKPADAETPTGATVPIAAAPQAGAITITGTLADANDPIEMDTAPLLNRITIVRARTLRALTGGLIGTYDAETIQGAADVARTAVREVKAFKVQNNAYRAALSTAKTAVLAAELRYDVLVEKKQ